MHAFFEEKKTGLSCAKIGLLKEINNEIKVKESAIFHFRPKRTFESANKFLKF